jgi:hypothetical protein
LFSGGFFFSVSQAAAALTNAMGGGRKFVSAICVRRLHHIAARDGSATRQFSVPKNSFQSMSTVSLLRALAGSGSIPALTTKAVKEGTTIEPFGGVLDPEVQGETTCRRFLEFYSAQGNKILPSSTPVPDDPYPSPHICWHTSIQTHVS